MKKIAFLPLIAAIAGLLYLPFYGQKDLGQMEVQALAGRVEVVRDGAVTRVGDTAEIEVGDLIRTSEDGAAKLRLVADRKAWLQSESSVLVTGTKTLESRSGSLLAESLVDPIGLSFGDVKVEAGRGRFRIDQYFGSTRASSFKGTWQLSTPGQAPLRLSSFFQASVPAGQLPRAPRPYQLDAKDPWDSVQFDFLARVLELEGKLEAGARALSNELGSSRPGLSYFASLAGRQVEFMEFMHRYLNRPTGDLLIGFTVAQTSRKGLPIGSALDRAFELSDQGGRWGVVAEIMRAKESVLVAQLDRLLLGTGIIAGTGSSDSQPVFALTAPGESGPGGTIDVASEGDDPIDPGSDPQPPDDGGPPDGGGPPDDGGPPDGGGDPPPCDSDAECAAQEIIDSLPPASPSPSPSPTDGGLLDGAL